MTEDQWAIIPDDEFIEEAQRRVTRFSPDRYMSQQQADDRAARDIQRSAIASAWVRVAHGSDPKQDAINTTFAGKADIYQDHSPRIPETVE